MHATLGYTAVFSMLAEAELAYVCGCELGRTIPAAVSTYAKKAKVANTAIVW